MTYETLRTERTKSQTDAVVQRALEQFREWREAHPNPERKTLGQIVDAAKELAARTKSPLPPGIYP